MKDLLKKAFEAGERKAHAQDSTEGILGFDTEPDFETWYEQSQQPIVSGSGDLIQFAMYLTGHDEDTIKQMYRDWH